MEDLISIIVPIYNVEPYLEKCIESIIKQTYENIEIILVDDGSTDGSSRICDQYAGMDKRIKTIHQVNGGLTVARKAGVNSAMGKYVGFVDGDDWIEPNMYQVLHEYASTQKADIVTSAGYREYNQGTGTEILGDTIPEGRYEVDAPDEYVLEHVFSSSFGNREHLNGAVWNKIFKREIISKVLNEMDDHIHGFMDDNVCVVSAVVYSKTIYVSHDCLYHHRERGGAFGYSANPWGLMQINYAYLGLKKIIENAGYKEKLYSALCEHTSIRIAQAYNIFFEDENFRLPQYLFRDNSIPHTAKIIIYGAGKVGRDYERQFRAENRYEIVGFVDKNAAKLTSETIIYSIDELLDLRFDFVIIAIENKETVNQIRNNLMRIGISNHAIIWQQPLSIFEYFNRMVV